MYWHRVLSWPGSEQGTSLTAAVICPKQDCSFFFYPIAFSSLIVLLLASCCSNINCSSLLSRLLLFVIPRSLPRRWFSSLGSACLCVSVFYNECCCVCGIWEERDHGVLWGHLVSFSKLFLAGTVTEKLVDCSWSRWCRSLGFLSVAECLTDIRQAFWEEGNEKRGRW